jgi:hypothetical protein
MTSTANIEKELEGLSESVLENLDPEERAALAVELAAAGEYDKVETVKQAAPMKNYKARDLTFSGQLTDHVVMALYAMWELESGVWKFFYEKAQGRLEEADYDRFPDEDWTEPPSEENGYHERAANDAAANFLGDYLAWEKYAAEDVCVPLEKFLSHPFSDGVRQKVSTITFTATLAQGGSLDEELPGWAEDGEITVDGQSLSFEEYAEWKYSQLTEANQ